MSEAIHDHGLLRTLQEEVRARLQEDEMLFAPPRTLIIAEDIGDIESEITKAIGPLNTGGGVVIVGSPEMNTPDPKRPFMFSVNIKFQCLELSIVNRSASGNQVYAERLAEIIHILMRNWEPATNGWSGMLLREWRTGPAEKFKGYVADVIVFQTETCYETEQVV